MKPTRYAQVQGIIRRQKESNVCPVDQLVRRRKQVVLDDAVQQQMAESADHPGDACLIGGIVVFGAVGRTERLEVEHRKESEADVRYREEIGKGERQWRPALLVAKIVDVD